MLTSGLFNQVLGMMVLSLLFFSCKTGRNNKKDSSRQRHSHFTSEDSVELALVDEKDIPIRKNVHAIQLDESEFRVNGVRVNKQTYINSQTPVIIYEMPPLADYVEIMRCPVNAAFIGAIDSFDGLQTKSQSLEEETRILQRNNFWEEMNKTTSCSLIASNFSDIAFFDGAAPTGEFFYYVRACVSAERLEGGDSFSSYACSRQITRSGALKHTNERKKAELKALAAANELSNKVYTAAHRVETLNNMLAKAIKGCQDQNGGRPVVAKDQRDSIMEIAGITAASVGGVGAAAIGATAIPKIRQSSHADNIRAGGAGMIMAASIGYISTAIATASTPASDIDFPRDASQCYGDSQRKLAEEWVESLGAKGFSKTGCRCTDTVRLQEELKSAGKRLDQLQELHNLELQKAGKKIKGVSTSVDVRPENKEKEEGSGSESGQEKEE